MKTFLIAISREIAIKNVFIDGILINLYKG
jgi:hypothetical protein